MELTVVETERRPARPVWPVLPVAHPARDRAAGQSPAALRVDPLLSPPDPRLVALLGPERVARLGLLPWRRCGADCVVLAEDPVLFLRHRGEVEAALGPVRLARCRESALRTALDRVAGAELVARAESRVPERLSCRGWRRAAVLAWALALGAGLAFLGWAMPVLPVILVLAAAILTMLGGIALKLAALWLSFRRSGSDCQTPPVAVPHRPPVVSLFVPLHKEARIAGALLERLGRLDYPADRLDICLILEASDSLTRTSLRAAELPPNAQIITVPEGSLQTKPRALNYALDFARGSIIGIYDAEDAPAPDQITRVVRRFAERGPGVACLQGELDYYNTGTNWIARCFTLEYATWFRLILPGLEKMGLVVPLGGTTVFLRREAIEAVGGWDAHNVTEDADLGIRLARMGYRTELIDTTTMEEANARAWPWIRQRSRWLKGYAVTYAVHMRDPARLWREIGGWRFAGIQILFLGTLVQLATAPLLWSFWLHLMGLPHPLVAALPGAAWGVLFGLFLFGEVLSVVLAWRATRLSGRRWLWLWAPVMQAYFPLATIALYKALWELVTRPFYWDKTEHGAFGGTEMQGDYCAASTFAASSLSRVSNALEM